LNQNRVTTTTTEHPAMTQSIEYFLAQARHISDAVPALQIHGVLFNTTIGIVATGTVYGHKSAAAGSHIRTSQIVGAHTIHGFHVVETKSGSNYLLARIGPSKTFRQQWRSLEEHLAAKGKAHAEVLKSDFSSFDPGLMQTRHPGPSPGFIR